MFHGRAIQDRRHEEIRIFRAIQCGANHVSESAPLACSSRRRRSRRSSGLRAVRAAWREAFCDLGVVGLRVEGPVADLGTDSAARGRGLPREATLWV